MLVWWKCDLSANMIAGMHRLIFSQINLPTAITIYHLQIYCMTSCVAVRNKYLDYHLLRKGTVTFKSRQWGWSYWAFKMHFAASWWLIYSEEWKFTSNFLIPNFIYNLLKEKEVQEASIYSPIINTRLENVDIYCVFTYQHKVNEINIQVSLFRQG
jgi:hypothetical protein